MGTSTRVVTRPELSRKQAGSGYNEVSMLGLEYMQRYVTVPCDGMSGCAISWATPEAFETSCAEQMMPRPVEISNQAITPNELNRHTVHAV
jgi:hypothetical protein